MYQSDSGEQVFNPFLPLWEYVPDGEPHVFGDRVYLFGSHDKEGGDTFCMLDYVAYSANVNDLKHWRYEGIIYHATQDADYSEEKPYMYAPDVVQGNDGRFYLYYCLSGRHGKGGYSGHISVAVCDTPAGQYQYLGFVRNPDGSPMKKYVCFDPAVMNDAGVIRLYYGTQYPYEEEPDFRENPELIQKEADMFGKSVEEILHTPESVMGASMCVLEDDMLTVKIPARHIIPYAVKHTDFEEHPFFEAPSMRKIGQNYYFIYSSWQNHELCYAVSAFPDRAFTYKGVIISNGDIGYHGRKPEDRLNMTGTTHGSIVRIQNQYYIFYHRLTHKSDYSRQACAEQILLQPDGSFAQVEMTSCGLNHAPLSANAVYPAVIACNITNGHMPHGSNQIFTAHFPHVTHDAKDRYIAEISDTSWIGYKYFRFCGGETLRIKYRSTGAGVFRVTGHMPDCLPDGDAAGQILGTLPVAACDDWQETETPLQIPAGIHALYLQYTGQGEASLLELTLCPKKKPEREAQNAGLFTVMAVLAVTVLLFAGGSVAGRFLNDTVPDTEILEQTETMPVSDVTNPVNAETNPEMSPEPDTVSGIVPYPSGDYAIGKDIPAGLYLAAVNPQEQTSTYGEFYFSVHTDAAMREEDRILSEWSQNTRYLALAEGQYLHISHAELYPVSDGISGADAFSGGGMYQVGTDIAAGNYRLIADQEYAGQYAVYEDAQPQTMPVLSCSYLETGEEAEIALQEGQFLKLKFCRLSEKIADTNPADFHCYIEGGYVIGEDIPAGLYFARCAETSGRNDGTFRLDVYAANALDEGAVLGGWMQNCCYVALEDGQYLTYSDAVLYPVTNAPVGNPGAESGMYLTGRDIPEGTYSVIAQEGKEGIVTIYDSAGTDAVLLSVKTIPAPEATTFSEAALPTVTVHTGEFLQLRNCHLVLS